MKPVNPAVRHVLPSLLTLTFRAYNHSLSGLASQDCSEVPPAVSQLPASPLALWASPVQHTYSQVSLNRLSIVPLFFCFNCGHFNRILSIPLGPLDQKHVSPSKMLQIFISWKLIVSIQPHHCDDSSLHHYHLFKPLVPPRYVLSILTTDSGFLSNI